MLLQAPAPVEPRCRAGGRCSPPLAWSVPRSFAGGIGLKAYAAPVPKKDESAKEEPKNRRTQEGRQAKAATARRVLPRPRRRAFQNFQPGALPLNPVGGPPQANRGDPKGTAQGDG